MVLCTGVNCSDTPLVYPHILVNFCFNSVLATTRGTLRFNDESSTSLEPSKLWLRSLNWKAMQIVPSVLSFLDLNILLLTTVCKSQLRIFFDTRKKFWEYYFWGYFCQKPPFFRFLQKLPLRFWSPWQGCDDFWTFLQFSNFCPTPSLCRSWLSSSPHPHTRLCLSIKDN